MTPTPDVAMAVARLTRHCSLMEAAPQYKWPDYLPDIRLVLAHLTTLSARNKALAELLGEALSSAILSVALTNQIRAALAAEKDRK